MAWLKEVDIDAFINTHNYDIRISHNARWIDQKCAADVVCMIADCILNYIDEKGKVPFTSRDIWYSNYSVTNIQAVFKKVEIDDSSAKSEYDKFFQQPMKMFSYAGILSEIKHGRENVYEIVSTEVLQYIALRERNALVFLEKYITKVLTDSGLITVFNEFFSTQTKDSYTNVKNAFSSFTIRNTAIGSRTSCGGRNAEAGVVECNRIFIKVLNPLAYLHNALGTERGNLSKGIITYDMLMYNRDNFRDIYAEKPKSMARKDYIEQKKIKINSAYMAYQITRAKMQLRKYNDIYRAGQSEIAGTDEHAAQMHHIFLASEFPEISYYLENLIAITPDQHYGHAHPGNKTSIVDRQYQYMCLVAKISSIKENLEHGEYIIYTFDNFKYVLSVGLNDEKYLPIENDDYNSILARLNICYS